MPEEQAPEFVKYYTRARKFPQLLGRFPDGTKIPGGPYTVQQLLAGVGIIAFGSMTMGIWGVFGGLGNVVVLIMTSVGVMFLIGRLPMNGRNPLFAAMGFVRASSAPRGGRYQGRPIKIRGPRHVTHRTNVWRGPLPEVTNPVIPHVTVEPVRHATTVKTRKRATPETVAVGALPRSESAGSSAPLTGVQALLARAGSPERNEAVHDGHA